MIAAVVFDMDGVIVDSEQVWDEVREELVADWGGRYSGAAQRAMMGMSSPEWSRYMHDELGLPQEPDEINAEVVRRMLERYHGELPLLDGAVDAVRALAASYPLAVASSSNRPLIDAVLETAGIAECFVATVSSEEVPRGKPSPDVYLEAARRLGVRADALRRGRGLGERHPRREDGRDGGGRRIRTRTIPRTPRHWRSPSVVIEAPRRAPAAVEAKPRRQAEASPGQPSSGRAGRSRCGRRGPSRSRAQTRGRRPCGPRSGRSRGRARDPGCGS